MNGKTILTSLLLILATTNILAVTGIAQTSTTNNTKTLKSSGYAR